MQDCRSCSSGGSSSNDNNSCAMSCSTGARISQNFVDGADKCEDIIDKVRVKLCSLQWTLEAVERPGQARRFLLREFATGGTTASTSAPTAANDTEGAEEWGTSKHKATAGQAAGAITAQNAAIKTTEKGIESDKGKSKLSNNCTTAEIEITTGSQVSTAADPYDSYDMCLDLAAFGAGGKNAGAVEETSLKSWQSRFEEVWEMYCALPDSNGLLYPRATGVLSADPAAVPAGPKNKEQGRELGNNNAVTLGRDSHVTEKEPPEMRQRKEQHQAWGLLNGADGDSSKRRKISSLPEDTMPQSLM